MPEYKKKAREHNGIQVISMAIIVFIMSTISIWIWYTSPPKVPVSNEYIPFTAEDVEYFTGRFEDDSDSLSLKYQ
jgi:hypothetical protein